jgi:Domain of unknown function (DUF4397)
MLRPLVVAFTLVLLWTSSCKKSDSVVTPASVNVVHAITNGKPIIPVFSDNDIQYFKTAQSISYGSAVMYYSQGGAQPLYVTKSTDSVNRIYSSELDFSEGSIYSLFFAGDTTHPEAVLIQDEIPVYQDSVAGVRFINLSPASAPIKVNIKGNSAGQTEYSNLAYKQITDFKSFTATAEVPGGRYIFEVRNQANDSLLLTYTWNYALFKCNTLVFSGAVKDGKATSLSIFPVKNY